MHAFFRFALRPSSLRWLSPARTTMSSPSLFFFCKLYILTGSLAINASALTCKNRGINKVTGINLLTFKFCPAYINYSRLASDFTLSPTTSADLLGSLILHGLEDVASSSTDTTTSPQASFTSSSGSQIESNMSSFFANGSIIGYSTASAAPKVTMSGDVFTVTPNVRYSPEAIATARQCWSEVLTWSSSSYSWYQASVANRVWPLVTSASIDQAQTFWTSTYYPASPSVYTLCDGSPRANVRPRTTTSTFNTTYSTHTWTSLATPTFHPQPCTPSGEDCHIWYNASGIREVNEDSILKLCGNPAGGPDGQCVFGIEGAVELIYFPVKTANGSICAGNVSTISQGKPLSIRAL